MLKWLLCGLLGHRWISKLLVSTKDEGFMRYEKWKYFQSPFCVRCGRLNPNYPVEKGEEDCD